MPISNEHVNTYRALCRDHGVKWDEESPRLIGETLDSMLTKYQEDAHLNNVALQRWDNLAFAFLVYNRGCGLSLSQVVCMEKQAARDMLDKHTKRVTRFEKQEPESIEQETSHHLNEQEYPTKDVPRTDARE